MQAVQEASKEVACGLERASVGTVTGAAVTSTVKVAEALPSLFSAVRAMVYSPASAKETVSTPASTVPASAVMLGFGEPLTYGFRSTTRSSPATAVCGGIVFQTGA